ncbi:response regulator receiver domain-containing protein [Streptomyces sp. SLBN-118]|uniref:response regulator n=1 Tax=Streptomyces sp. SLBN-118 TaxID=2768454 RepID=UPI0011517016|nr:response regulator [Streptomyces sp. SLBN-118]TQK44073.1 response regulator receiver domain-containing protein [Streptomyces sp. SLBN-118]
MGTPRVLVIEDNVDVSALLKRHLSGLGCQVAVADTGEEGLERAFADPPDMAIIDIMLPGIDGREVIRRLRADTRTSTCHLVVSTVLDPEDVTELAVDAMLAKPFRRSSVMRLIDSFRNSASQET